MRGPHPSTMVRDERFWIATGVALLHVWALGWLLSQYAPSTRQTGPEAVTTQVYFIPRQASRDPEAATASPPLPLPDLSQTPGSPPNGVASQPVTSTPTTPEGTLTVVTLPREPTAHQTLRLPDDYVEIEFKPHDGVTGKQLAVDPRTTRFNDDWATDGDLIEKLEEDNIAVRIALNLFGGRDGCTEQALRERRRGCVGKDYQPEMHEAVQGR